MERAPLSRTLRWSGGDSAVRRRTWGGFTEHKRRQPAIPPGDPRLAHGHGLPDRQHHASRAPPPPPRSCCRACCPLRGFRVRRARLGPRESNRPACSIQWILRERPGDGHGGGQGVHVCRSPTGGGRKTPHRAGVDTGGARFDTVRTCPRRATRGAAGGGGDDEGRGVGSTRQEPIGVPRKRRSVFSPSWGADRVSEARLHQLPEPGYTGLIAREASPGHGGRRSWRNHRVRRGGAATLGGGDNAVSLLRRPADGGGSGSAVRVAGRGASSKAGVIPSRFRERRTGRSPPR